jgi:hypothetical protein
MEDVETLADIEQDFQETLIQSQEVTMQDALKEKRSIKVLGWMLKVFAPLM